MYDVSGISREIVLLIEKRFLDISSLDDAWFKMLSLWGFLSSPSHCSTSSATSRLGFFFYEKRPKYINT